MLHMILAMLVSLACISTPAQTNATASVTAIGDTNNIGFVWVDDTEDTTAAPESTNSNETQTAKFVCGTNVNCEPESNSTNVDALETNSVNVATKDVAAPESNSEEFADSIESTTTASVGFACGTTVVCGEEEEAEPTDTGLESAIVFIDGWAYTSAGQSWSLDNPPADPGPLGEAIWCDQYGNIRTPTRLMPNENGQVVVKSVKGVLNGQAMIVETFDGFKAMFQISNPDLGPAYCVDPNGVEHYGPGCGVEIIVLPTAETEVPTAN